MTEPMDVGVDIGVRRIAIGSVHPAFSSSIDLGKKPGDRQYEVHMLSRWMREQPIRGARLWIERPYLSSSISNPDTSIAMGETVGVIRAAGLWSAVTMVHQSSWKAQVLGNGKADKDEIRGWVEREWPMLADLCLGVEDRYDAMCIGVYGKLVQEGTVQLPVPKPRKPRRRAATT